MCENFLKLFDDIIIDEKYKEVPPKAAFKGAYTVIQNSVYSEKVILVPNSPQKD